MATLPTPRHRHIPLREVPVALPHLVLPDANWADAFEVQTSKSFASMRALASQTIGSMPGWARVLLKLRNILVVPFGLKADGLKEAEDRIDIFPVLEETHDQIVLGLDDRHLNFRIVVECFAQEHGNRVRATTLVTRHNLFGRLYIAAVTPFHRTIVQSVLRRAL